MFRTAYLSLILLCFLAASGGLAIAADTAGTVTRLRGTAQASGPDGARTLEANGAIFVGDRIQTGADTRLELTLTDDAVLTLGDNSTLLIDQYLVNTSGQGGSGALNVLNGVFLAVTGRLAKTPGASFQVTTPVATIGVRGTTFWGEIGSDGLLVALLDGNAIVVRNAAGQVVIDRAGVATQVPAQNAAPAPPFALSAEQLNAARGTVAW